MAMNKLCIGFGPGGNSHPQGQPPGQPVREATQNTASAAVMDDREVMSRFAAPADG